MRASLRARGQRVNRPERAASGAARARTRLVRALRHAISLGMADPTTSSTLDRIDRAIERIEAAAAARTASTATLQQRHEKLRARMAEAVAALDAVIARESEA